MNITLVYPYFQERNRMMRINSFGRLLAGVSCGSA